MSEVSKKFEPSDKPQGRYVDLKPLTSGGMGMVYKAYDTILDKPIAIKTLIFDHKTESLAARFQQEARLVSKLNHPNIVSILDFGLSKEEEPYMVMDFVDGVSLASLIKEKGKYKGQEITDIAKQICRGMAHAHSKGIVHRDIKPGNILIQNEAAEGENVRIVDFGIAKVDNSEEVSGFRTSGSQVLGSPLFMSPEQVESRKIDHRTDIYSLGCVIYMMAAGHPPFHGDSAMDTMQAHVNEMPDNPCVSDENATLAKNLDKLILKCLEKDPDSRFQSMEEVIETIESHDFSLDKNTNVFDLPNQEESHKKSSVTPIILIMVLGVILLGGLFYGLSVFNSNKPVNVSQIPRTAKTKKKEALEKFAKTPLNKFGTIYTLTPKNFKEITEEDLVYVSRHLKGTRDIILKDIPVTDKGLEVLTSLKLWRIDLTGAKITNKAAKILNQFSMLRDLTLEDTAFGDEGIALLKCPALISLNLSNCSFITDKTIDLLVENHPKLGSLNIEGCAISQSGLLRLCELKRLYRLNLSGYKITDEVVDCLTKSKTLEKLSVIGAKISNKNLDRLVQIKSLKEIDATLTRPDYDTWIKEVFEKYGVKNGDLNARNMDNVPTEGDLPDYLDMFISK